MSVISGDATRRRRFTVQSRGRLMSISRAAQGSVALPFVGYSAPPTTNAVQMSGVAKVAVVIHATNDEMQAASYEPRTGDKILDGVRSYTLTDAVPIYDGSSVSGWMLSAAGGK